jgi:WD40 repeat protein
MTSRFPEINYLQTKYVLPTGMALCLILTVITLSVAQRRNSRHTQTGFDDVVFAVSFSPDAKTLAIARGASEPAQRFGRIELWDTETGKLRHVIKGFDGPVMSISFSPDGQTLVSGSLEYRSSKIQEKARSREGMVSAELKWWDGYTGELKHKLTMGGEGVSSLNLTLSPDGKDLVVAQSFIFFSFLAISPTFQPSGGPDSPFVNMPNRPIVSFGAEMKLLDAQTGELKLKLSSGQSSNTTYSPDGAFLAVVRGKEIKLWNSQTGKDERKFKGFKGRPTALAFSPDGRLLAVATMSFDRESAGDYIKIIGTSEVRLFDVRSGREMRKFTGIGAVNTVAFSPSGKFLFLGGVTREGETDIPGFSMLNLETSKLASFPVGDDYSEAVDSIALSKDGTLLAFRSGRETVKLLDTKTLKVKQTLDSTSVGSGIERPASRFLVSVKRVLAVAFSADGRTVAAETDQGEIKLWDPRTGEVRKELTNGQDDPTLVAVSADGKSFAEFGEGNVQFWSSGSDAKQTVPLPAGVSISAMAMSADSQTVALASAKDVLLINAAGKVSRTLTGQHGAINNLAFSVDGRVLAASAEDGTIEIWNLASQRIERTIAAGLALTALRFSPNGQILAAATADRDVTLWNLQSGLAQAKLEKHDAVVNALTFSADGQLLASGGDDRTVFIWETVSGKSKRKLKGHDQTVTSLAFSPDGRLLASGSGNASVVLWEVQTGKFNRVLR